MVGLLKLITTKGLRQKKTIFDSIKVLTERLQVENPDLDLVKFINQRIPKLKEGILQQLKISLPHLIQSSTIIPDLVKEIIKPKFTSNKPSKRVVRDIEMRIGNEKKYKHLECLLKLSEPKNHEVSYLSEYLMVTMKKENFRFDAGFFGFDSRRYHPARLEIPPPQYFGATGHRGGRANGAGAGL